MNFPTLKTIKVLFVLIDHKQTEKKFLYRTLKIVTAEYSPLNNNTTQKYLLLIFVETIIFQGKREYVTDPNILTIALIC